MEREKRSPLRPEVEQRNRRLRIYRSNYGRISGWYVEKEGQKLAELIDWRNEDMFWDSYRIVPITQYPDQIKSLFTTHSLHSLKKLRIFIRLLTI